MALITEAKSFEWDRGNTGKNWRKHRVRESECEEVFFDEEKLVLSDAIHSEKEERSALLGQTKKKRRLFVVFTLRQNKIRVISARDLSRKERALYEKTTGTTKI